MRHVRILLMLCLSVGACAQTRQQCAKLRNCPDDGCGARRDSALNRQKNRSQAPAHYRDYTYSDFVSLNGQTVHRKLRDSWTPVETARITDVENGDGVSLVAYFVDATLSDPETCNCFRSQAKNRDYHIWLAEDAAGAKQKNFIVVEMTPKGRAANRGWTLQRLRRLRPKAGQPWTQVRVRGYAFFDNEHWDFPERKPPIRATAWEIHPVTEFAYCAAGETCTIDSNNWVKLEDMKTR